MPSALALAQQLAMGFLHFAHALPSALALGQQLWPCWAVSSAVVLSEVVSVVEAGFLHFSHALPSACALAQQLWLWAGVSAAGVAGACSVTVVEAHPMV